MKNFALHQIERHIADAARDPDVCLGCLAMLLTDAPEQLVEAHPGPSGWILACTALGAGVYAVALFLGRS